MLYITDLQLVLGQLQAATFTLKSSKFSSGMSSTTHLGLEYSGEMIRPSTEKIHAIADWPTPKSPKEVRSFLGLDNFYHCYIPKFVVIMQYFLTG